MITYALHTNLGTQFSNFFAYGVSIGDLEHIFILQKFVEGNYTVDVENYIDKLLRENNTNNTNRRDPLVTSLSLLASDKQFQNDLKSIFPGENLTYDFNSIANKIRTSDSNTQSKFKFYLVATTRKYINLDLIKTLNYDDYFYVQGSTNLNMHFNIEIPEHLNVMLADFRRSVLYNTIPQNSNLETQMQDLSEISRHMTYSYYNPDFFTRDTPPTLEEETFWVLLNSGLTNSQRNGIKKIMYKVESELTTKEKLLKDTLKNPDFQTNFINQSKAQFKYLSSLTLENIENCNFQIDAAQFDYILHAPENELINNQKQEKYAPLKMFHDENDKNKRFIIQI